MKIGKELSRRIVAETFRMLIDQIEKGNLGRETCDCKDVIAESLRLQAVRLEEWDDKGSNHEN